MTTPAPTTQHFISFGMSTNELKTTRAYASIDFIQPGPG